MTRTARLFGMLTLAFALPIVALACSDSPTATRREVPPKLHDDCGPIPPPDSLCRNGGLGSGSRTCC